MRAPISLEQWFAERVGIGVGSETAPSIQTGGRHPFKEFRIKVLYTIIEFRPWGGRGHAANELAPGINASL